ncbi:MAG TPA: nucleotidyltransferase domain-containing protein [Chloroflexota bacterium]|nr:nucleotidyltransferase domain-containing protein [Chloroflexota bacterium]
MFRAEDRETLRTHLIAQARSDDRVVAAAAVGGSAGGGDRWSDLDLTFGVADGVPVAEVLTDWTRMMAGQFDAAVLFDLPYRSSIYRVFLLPGMLQVDLSFTPSAEFGAHGPRFHLLFGTAVTHPAEPSAPLEHLFGLGIHHLVRARMCVERGRLWQAEYWIHEARDEALTLACRRLGLESSHGRGFDQLPSAVRDSYAGSLVGQLTADALQRAAGVVLAALLHEGADIPEATRIRSIMKPVVLSRR